MLRLEMLLQSNMSHVKAVEATSKPTAEFEKPKEVHIQKKE